MAKDIFKNILDKIENQENKKKIKKSLKLNKEKIKQKLIADPQIKLESEYKIDINIIDMLYYFTGPVGLFAYYLETEKNKTTIIEWFKYKDLVVPFIISDNEIYFLINNGIKEYKDYKIFIKNALVKAIQGITGKHNERIFIVLYERNIDILKCEVMRLKEE